MTDDLPPPAYEDDDRAWRAIGAVPASRGGSVPSPVDGIWLIEADGEGTLRRRRVSLSDIPIPAIQATPTEGAPEVDLDDGGGGGGDGDHE